MKQLRGMTAIQKILKKYPTEGWTSQTEKNETGAYGYTETLSHSGKPILKIVIDSARQWGKVFLV